MKSVSITVQKVQLQLVNSEKQQPDELIRDHQAKHHVLYELNIVVIISTNTLHIVGIINKRVKASEQVIIIISLYVSPSRFLDSSERWKRLYGLSEWNLFNNWYFKMLFNSNTSRVLLIGTRHIDETDIRALLLFWDQCAKYRQPLSLWFEYMISWFQTSSIKLANTQSLSCFGFYFITIPPSYPLCKTYLWITCTQTHWIVVDWKWRSGFRIKGNNILLLTTKEADVTQVLLSDWLFLLWAYMWSIIWSPRGHSYFLL